MIRTCGNSPAQVGQEAEDVIGQAFVSARELLKSVEDDHQPPAVSHQRGQLPQQGRADQVLLLRAAGRDVGESASPPASFWACCRRLVRR